MKTDAHLWSHLAEFFLEWEMFQTKVIDKIKTHFLCPVTFFMENRAYEIMWKNIIERGRPQTTTWRMRIAFRIPKVTDTHSEYVIIIGFPLQQWLCESTSMLRRMYLVFVISWGDDKAIFLLLNISKVEATTHASSTRTAKTIFRVL
jgi:hypothetical protein